MLVVRPVKEQDEPELERLSLAVGYGLTSLPRGHASWLKKITQSLDSFAQTPAQHEAVYLFVLEDTHKSTICGTCQVISNTAGSTGGYYYHMECRVLPKTSLQHAKEIGILSPVHRMTNATEVGGLYLDPATRQQGLSRLLSLCRFLFIAAHRSRFHNQVIAEIRGHIEANRSPFWDAVGRHFIDIEFDELMRRLMIDPTFIPGILAPVPILVPLLPPAVKAVLGKPHERSHTALRRLLEQGFSLTGDIDLFDAGPKVACDTDQIKIVREHTAANIKTIGTKTSQRAHVILSNAQLSFRACLAEIGIDSDDSIEISQEVANALELKLGDRVHYVKSKDDREGKS